MCAISSPEVFTLDDDGLVQTAYEGIVVPPDLVSETRFAMATCPVAALRER